ncbi:MAG: sigma-54 dependent transcriptional regulator [Saprospiraceae bacterium]|nr:sigma-54 dependent transcriptional regulator [Saprospiraceae bacterium]
MNLQSVKQRFGIIGRSQELDRALSTAVRVASTDLTVLITGESGVGKEVFSHIIHSLSPRKHNKFIAINTGAIPEGTINSELFGHEKGAFTGATSERKGYFETVNGGTIFLDEIGEMPLDTQAFLLRVLESGEFIRVGSSKVLKTDVRIIAASNVDLLEQIRKGKFREDLYYRLNTVPIRVPPLRMRKDDILMLFRKFAVDFAEQYRMDPIQLTEDARKIILSYTWPGNIRELKNVVEQLSVLSEEKMITADTLIDAIPNIQQGMLPAIAQSNSEQGPGLHEREILYQLLFDMKSDLNDLKQLVFELIKSNNLSVPDIQKVRELQTPMQSAGERAADKWDAASHYAPDGVVENRPGSPIIIHPDDTKYDLEEVEESLSLESMEKDLISKALQKHKGRRKDAAEELGISERTLYRKIKLYDL